MTLKTEVIMQKIQRCVTGINYISTYIKTENSYFKLYYFTILVFTVILNLNVT